MKTKIENQNLKSETEDLFRLHPCGDCEHYATNECVHMECDKFCEWFNSVYVQMMQFNALWNDNRISINGKFKDYELEIFDREENEKSE